MMPDAARKCWKEGFQVQLSDSALLALARGLAADDERLIQGHALQPPVLSFLSEWTVEGADPVAFALWQGDLSGVASVGQVEELWVEACCLCDQVLGQMGASSDFLTWWHDTPRGDARLLLLAETNRELKRRGVLPLTAA